MEITLQQFEAMCQNRQLHNGYVEGLGCVFWRSRYVISSDTTSTESFSTPFYELVVIKDEKNIESGLQPLEGLIDKGTTALSLYGIANSFEQLSQKPIVIGEKYIQINRQGTLVRNPNRVYTTKGEVAKGVGRKIYIAGLVIDTALWISGKQTFSEAALNMGVNTGIYIIGSYFPPVGIALGILWFITSVSKRPYISPPSYEEIHGTITPADATRVDRPYYCEPMRVRPNHKKHILRQLKKLPCRLQSAREFFNLLYKVDYFIISLNSSRVISFSLRVTVFLSAAASFTSIARSTKLSTASRFLRSSLA